jgi:protein-S-isoprenylcysteine O-methyltransferase Ste14
MKWQIVIVVLCALNLLSIWSTVWLDRCRWYRPLGYLVMAILPFLSVFPNQPHFDLDYFWWKIAGGVAIVLGVLILGWALVEFSKKKGALFTSGPYLYVRHPQYLGLVFILVGWWWLWAAVYGFYFGMIILALIWLQGYLEEKLILEKQFGQAYLDYKKLTGMFWIK